MSQRAGPSVYSIAAHRGFADALVAGLIPRYRTPDLGLARVLLLLPSRRAVRNVTEAFVRAGGEGLLLPRMVTVGDLDLDEQLPALFDLADDEQPIPPAADPTWRWLRLASILASERGDGGSSAPLLREARQLARTLDRLTAEEVGFTDLLQVDLGDLAEHWREATRTFAVLMARWQAELAERGEIDAAERRNLLLRASAERWRAQPPDHPVVAAGVTSAAPAIAALLRSVSELPDGAVILPDLDLAMNHEVWEALGNAGAPSDGSREFSRDDAVTHPQYHLKLLLNRMGIARDEVDHWHRAGLAPTAPERSRAISNMFLPPEASAAWVSLPASERRMGGVRVMECARPEEEAQAIAVLVREALAVPGERIALVTPDRSLARRVIGHLTRWGIVADDTAGTPLSQTPAGRLFLSLATAAGDTFSPVSLLALLTHPLANGGLDRPDWLDRARELDLALRGVRPGTGLDAIGHRLLQSRLRKAYPQLAEWWAHVAHLLAPLDGNIARSLSDWLAMLQSVAEELAGITLWGNADGRALAQFVEGMAAAAPALDRPLEPGDMAAALQDAMAEVAVRPPYGGHPRFTVYGLLESRMARAETMICAGLVEGSWPPVPAPDPLLAPGVLRQLGVPGAEFRIGLSAHDLAGALGAPQVILSYSHRDLAGPVIPSRFLLRLQAMLGDQLVPETRAVELARSLADAPPEPPAERPKPRPSAEQRRVDISATALDRLRGDPYQFYASKVLGLSSLDALDAELSPAERGNIAHKALEKWHQAGLLPGGLIPLAESELARITSHPIVRALWRPRLFRALEWIEQETLRQQAEGRSVVGSEIKGEMKVRGVTVHGRADRVDRLPDGSLAIVDYKTGRPPSGKMVEDGFALQLGILGLIARAGGMRVEEIPFGGEPTRFEYWSFGRSDTSETGFGFIEEPVLDPDSRKKQGIPREQMLSETSRYLDEALDRWILGNDPFTARLNPDLPVYGDYDQLMRLDEWQARGDLTAAEGEA